MNDRGSVTVYSLIVVVPIVLFLGLLFDFVRIQAAEAQAEKALKAAVRSVLSAYDRDLRASYGLFGLAAEEEERSEIAREIVEGYAGKMKEREKSDQGWGAVNPELKEIEVASLYTLADHRFFHRQIMEEMKVKAPVEFTRRVFDKWKGQAPQMEQAAGQFEVSEKMERWLEQRENRLREAFAALEAMRSTFDEGRSILSQSIPEPDETEEAEQNGETPAAIPDERGNEVFSELQQTLNELKTALNEARKADDRVRQQMENETENADLFKDIYILGHEFYLRYELGAAAPISMFGAAVSARNAGAKFVDHSYDDAFSTFFAAKSAEEQKRRSAYDDLDKRKKEEQRKTQERVDQVKETLSKQVCRPEEEKRYVRLVEFYQGYLNENSKQADNGDSIHPEAALEQTPAQLTKGSLLGLSGLSEAVKLIRDEAYINEYVMMYFNNRLTSRQQDPLIADIQSHLLQDQEAEYILYGLSSCTANRAAAYAEMFTVRFAVRTIEALTDTRKAALGSPMLILLTAAAEGALKAQQDMNRLLNGEAVPVFAKLSALKMGYTDYIRTFLTIHSEEANKMARMQALIQLNTGVDLNQRPVYVQAESRSKLSLWMIPSVSRTVEKSGRREGEASSLEIVKSAAMAY